MILAGDIGGTKTRLALVEPATGRLVASQTYGSREHETFAAVVDDFRREHPHPFGPACLGVAGPVMGGRVDVTNLPWVIDVRDLERLGYKSPMLVNDMVAYGAGIEQLDATGVKTLNVGVERPGNRALIAAGTGLGESFLTARASGGWTVHATEGGHVDFSPTTDDEIALLKYLRRTHRRVSWERVLSGRFGFTNIGQFLADTGRYPEDSGVIADLATQDDGGPILTKAASAGSTLAQDAMRFFARLYGVEAGNLALKYMALGGVYIGGGIAERIMQWLEGPEFLAGYSAKGRFSTLVASIPVHVITDPDCAAKGAALLAMRHL